MRAAKIFVAARKKSLLQTDKPFPKNPATGFGHHEVMEAHTRTFRVVRVNPRNRTHPVSQHNTRKWPVEILSDR